MSRRLIGVGSRKFLKRHKRGIRRRGHPAVEQIMEGPACQTPGLRALRERNWRRINDPR